MGQQWHTNKPRWVHTSGILFDMAYDLDIIRGRLFGCIQDFTVVRAQTKRSKDAIAVSEESSLYASRKEGTCNGNSLRNHSMRCSLRPPRTLSRRERVGTAGPWNLRMTKAKHEMEL